MSARNKLDDSIEKIPYVGPKAAQAFLRLKIKTVENLLRFMPRDAIDLSDPIEIKKAQKIEGEKTVIYGEVIDLKILKTPRRRIWLTSAKIKDKSGIIRVVWFNQPYLSRFFQNKKYAFYGPIEFSNFTKEKTLVSPQIFDEPGIITIYRQSENLTSKQIKRTVDHALKAGYSLEDKLLDQIAKKYGYLSAKEATQKLHFPKTIHEFWAAKQRFIFDELIIFITANLYLKNQNLSKSAYQIETDAKILNEFTKLLPFKLTFDQRKALREVVGDFEQKVPMNRLLQGDVGSGKTVVAFAGAYLAIKSGYQVAYLAPTQILARQHFETAKKIFNKANIKIELLTASTAKKTKNNNQFLKTDFIIGTHAILQKDVKIPRLALVIIDEQHRFGVEQRALLGASLTNVSRLTPHFLSLSATPIPRSLAHIIFGNLDISTIKSKPVGRLPIKTYLVPESKRSNSYRFIDDLIARRQQAFVVCPLIEERENLSGSLFDEDGRKAVEAEIISLQKTVLGKRKIEMLHGKMKGTDKEAKMMKMKDGEADVLVSTSVVEVGVDLPRATVMVIEGAEHFGLSQLHQFRGRVGRNSLPSYCFLFTGSNLNDKARERLKIFVRNDDGFKLSQMDLKGRGPGAILGSKQSGFFGINPLWFENSEILKKASSAAKNLVDNLKTRPDLEQKIKSQFETEHLE